MAAGAGQQLKALLLGYRLCPPRLCCHDTGLHGTRHTALPLLRRQKVTRIEEVQAPGFSWPAALSPLALVRYPHPEPLSRNGREVGQFSPQRLRRVAKDSEWLEWREKYGVQRSGREGQCRESWGDRPEREGQAVGKNTAVMEGKAPPRLTGGGRYHPAHLFGLSVLRWMVVGG